MKKIGILSLILGLFLAFSAVASADVLGDTNTQDVIIHTRWNRVVPDRDLNVDAFVAQHPCVTDIDTPIYGNNGVVLYYEYYTPKVVTLDPTVPVTNRTLGELMVQGGTYFVHCSNADPQPLREFLTPGWNLVSGDNTPLNLINSIYPQIAVIYGWDSTVQVWTFWAPHVPTFVIDLGEFSSTKAYWVFVN